MSQIDHELKIAARESSRSTARLLAFKATVLDRSQPMEIRLRAYMQIDAVIHARHSRVHDRMDDTPTKIDIAKENGERIRATRRRAKRLEAGLRTRRPRHPTGAWLSTEQSDKIKSGYRLCATCKRPVPDTRANGTEFCSPRCARAARAAKKGRER